MNTIMKSLKLKNNKNFCQIRKFFVVLFILNILFLLYLPAYASDISITWRRLSRGIWYWHALLKGPVEVHAVRVNVQDPTISLRTVLKNDSFKPDEGETTSSMAKRVKAEVAVNADYFGSCRDEEDYHLPLGTTVVNGKTFQINPRHPGLAISFGNYVKIGKWSRSMPWFYNVTGGGPIVLENGKIPSGVLRYRKKHPRTAVGISGDMRWIYLCVIDGRRLGSIGMDPGEVGELLSRLGADDGMLLDGGGSSTMVIKGRVVNHPSDERERKVASALVVLRRPDGESLYNPDFPEPTPRIKKIITRKVYRVGDGVEEGVDSIFFKIKTAQPICTRSFELDRFQARRNDGYVSIHYRQAEGSFLFLNGNLLSKLENTHKKQKVKNIIKIPPGVLRRGKNYLTIISAIKNANSEFDDVYDDLEFENVILYFGRPVKNGYE